MVTFTRERVVIAGKSRRWSQAVAAVALGVMWLAPSGADAAILKRVHASPTLGTWINVAGNPTVPVNIALELPDPSKAFVVCSASTTSTNASQRVTCTLSTNQLTIDGGSSMLNDVLVSWYVAEFESGVSVQRGTATLTQYNSTATASLSPVDCSKSFVVMAGEQIDGSVSSAIDELLTTRAILGTFASPCGVTPGATTSTLSISRNYSALTAAPTVAWQVVTMDGATVLARGAPTLLGTGAILTVTPSPAMAADPTKAFLLMSRAAGNLVAGVEAEYQVRGDLSTCSPMCSTVTFTRVSTTTTPNHQVDIAYEVVRLDDGSSVQHGSTTASGNTAKMPTYTDTISYTANSNIAAVARASAVPFFSVSSGSSTANTNLDETSWVVTFPTPSPGYFSTPITMVQFIRGASSSQAGTANWFVVSFYMCPNPRLCSLGATWTASNSTVTVSWSPIYERECVVGGSPATPSVCDAFLVRDENPITWAPTSNTGYTVGAQPSGGPATMRVVFNGSGQSFSETLAPGKTYYYRLYPKNIGSWSYYTDTGITQAISQVSVTPNANLAWSYSTTGGSTLNAPIAGSGKVYVASNGNKVTALNSSTGAEVAAPASTNGAIQGYLAWFPVSAGGGNEAVIAVDDKGSVTRVNALTGARQWTTQLPVDNIGSATTQGAIYATVSAQLGAYATCDGDAFKNQYGATTDLIYVASRNNGLANNKVWAVRASDGGIQWTFAPGTMDRATGQPFIDYCRNRLWVTTGNSAGQAGVWVINTITASATASAVTSFSGVGDQSTSAPTLSFASPAVWTGDFTGKVYAFDAGTPGTTPKYSRQLSGTSPQVTGFIWEDWATPGRLYVPVVVGGVGGVYCVQDTGAALQDSCSGWGAGGTATNPRLVPGTTAASQPLLIGTALFFPGSDGKLYQISTADGTLVGSGFVVESGIRLGGVSTEDWTQLYVGTTSGRSYRINLVGGNLP
jgi:hypothetical protein